MSSDLTDTYKGNPYVHPRDEIVSVMTRMYERGLTTMSGGNVSILDNEGNFWITPGSTDKGDMTSDQVVYCDFASTNGDATIDWQGDFPPSREWPFHTKILQKRPDCRAVLHAHSQTLVAFSVTGAVPNTLVSYQAHHLCGTAAMSAYRMPGAASLADVICEQIMEHDCVIMENHGIVVCGVTLQECYQKFEALEFCARALVKAHQLGGERLLLTPDDIQSQNELRNKEMKEWSHSFTDRPPVTTTECDLRAEIVKFAKRAYDQGLLISCIGAISARMGPSSFLITPQRLDRSELGIEDILLVDVSYQPAKIWGKLGLHPSKEWKLHGELYKSLPDIKSVILAEPFHFAAFCMTNVEFPTTVHPETYLVCRNVGRISFQDSQDYESVVRYFQAGHRALVINNKGVLITACSVQHAYDMLEIVESTTNVILDTKALGGFKLMTPEQVEEIDRRYFGTEPSKRNLLQKVASRRLDGHVLPEEDMLAKATLLRRRSSAAQLGRASLKKQMSLFLYGSSSITDKDKTADTLLEWGERSEESIAPP